jgi:hypothetical protein
MLEAFLATLLRYIERRWWKRRRLGVTGVEILAPKWKAEAQDRAAELAPVVRDLQAKGYSLRAWQRN